MFVHALEKQEKNFHEFALKNSSSRGVIKLIGSASEIDKDACRSILVNSFIGEYSQYLTPQDISKTSTSWRGGNNSVQQYYEKYFAVEFDKYSANKFEFWVCAYVDNQLVGWATFEREHDDKNAVYMDLLIVDPAYQHKGIGEQLVKSLLNLGAIPELSAVHLLLRKANSGGRIFYQKLGFYDDQDYHRTDNFVDLDMLVPLTWKNPALLETIKREHSHTCLP